MNIVVIFKPYYYFDGDKLVRMAGAFQVFNRDVLIGGAESREDALKIKELYLKEVNDHSPH